MWVYRRQSFVGFVTLFCNISLYHAVSSKVTAAFLFGFTAYEPESLVQLGLQKGRMESQSYLLDLSMT